MLKLLSHARVHVLLDEACLLVNMLFQLLLLGLDNLEPTVNLGSMLLGCLFLLLDGLLEACQSGFHILASGLLHGNVGGRVFLDCGLH